MKQNLETRVGYKTVSILFDITNNYIKNHIVDNKYVGRLDMLEKYQSLRNYLDNNLYEGK